MLKLGAALPALAAALAAATPPALLLAPLPAAAEGPTLPSPAVAAALDKALAKNIPKTKVRERVRVTRTKFARVCNSGGSTWGSGGSRAQRVGEAGRCHFAEARHGASGPRW